VGVVLVFAALAMSASLSHASSTGLQGTITVSAASSLTDAFKALARDFRQANPKVRVTFNFGSSSALVSQVQAGAPADVFAAADTASVDKLARTGHVNRTRRVFAKNSLMIAVKPANPMGIRSLKDMTRARVVALCAKAVPCGLYAATALQRAAVVLPESSVTRSVDARATIGAVVNGDADAAIVYSTDVKAAGGSVASIVISRDQNVTASYAIASIRRSTNAKVAQAFIDYVMSPAGRSTLVRFGFARP